MFLSPSGRGASRGRGPSELRDQASTEDQGPAPVFINELIEANLGFVVKVASQFRDCRLPFEDLVGEGTLGLIEAAHRYDASLGTKFITYAVWWIRKRMLEALSERSKLIRVPGFQTRKIREIHEADHSLRRSLGRTPTKEEIAANLQRSLGRIDQELQWSLRSVSLDHHVGEERDQSLHEFLADDTATNAEDKFISQERVQLLWKAFRELNAQEGTVVFYRFGFDGGGSRTLQKTGEIMDLSRERVRQIQRGALTRMSKTFAERRTNCGPDRFRRVRQTSRRGSITGSRFRPST